MSRLTPGYANEKGTQRYAKKFADSSGKGHYSDFLNTGIRLSSIGVGTFSGQATPEVDEQVAKIIAQAIASGINVIDTSAHYRYGRALAAIGAGLQMAFSQGYSRDEIFLVSKGGFLTLRGGKPDNLQQWFQQEIVAKGLGEEKDLARHIHLLSPAYMDYQIDLSRNLMGVETLDAFLIDQPEIHIADIGKENTNKKLLDVFVSLEKAVQENRIRGYGISSFESQRVETDDVLFQSITSMLGLAEKAARQATGDDTAKHHFKILQLPFNQVMTEGFARFNHATGQGNISSTLQAAYQLDVYVMASHTLLKGHLAQQSVDVVEQVMPLLKNPAQRAIQFNRSTPGVGTTLVGLSQLSHLSDIIDVSRQPPLDKKQYLSMYGKA